MRKKLIEVSIPLEAINAAASREKSIRHGHPSTLHLWWARRPLAAARAVIFAQMVDDPSSRQELFPTPEAQEKERQRLFDIIKELVKWENSNNETVIRQARDEIKKSWKLTCEDYKDDPRAAELYNPDKLPEFHDPFAGGGTIPLEAQRLGLTAYASDLNPVATLLNKAMIEIPPKFSGMPPTNPESRKDKHLIARTWKGVEGLSEDIRYYGKWMRNEAEKRIGGLYPTIKITKEMAAERADLKQYINRELTVVAWLWARTVKSPNPAYTDVWVPLASTFMVSTKSGKEAYIEPIIENGNYRFVVRTDMPKDTISAKMGTKISNKATFQCIISKVPIEGDYIKAEGRAGRMDARLMALVVEGERGRIYISPTKEQEDIARTEKPVWIPDGEVPARLTGGTCVPYGLEKWSDLFTSRQLNALTTFSGLINDVIKQIQNDSPEECFNHDESHLVSGGSGLTAYSEAIGIYLAFAISKLADRGSTICTWFTERDSTRNTFARQSIPMTWDYAELNTLLGGTGSFLGAVQWTAESLDAVACSSQKNAGIATQFDAMKQNISMNKVVSTDPPYYDNIGYADLSDFFYIWLRRSLQPIFPDLFSTVAVPKSEELVATPYRHGGKEKAESFFLEGMTLAMKRLAEQTHPGFPVTVYYAFKQSETKDAQGAASTGWETFLAALIQAGFGITGTWPMRTELGNRMVGSGANALASSIVLVCRKRNSGQTTCSRQEFLRALKDELPQALHDLQQGGMAPVDLAQAAIGPGMAVFTRYSQVLEADGEPLTVRQVLVMINELLDQVLAEQEGEFDTDSRWALSWFEEHGFDEGQYGIAETLSTAKNTSVRGLGEAGIIIAKSGKVRLLRPEEFPDDWDPVTDKRLTIWEVVHHLVRSLNEGGEVAAAELLSKLGGHEEAAKTLTYRLYRLCELKKRATEALAYNSLAQSWPEISRLARSAVASKPKQGGLF